MHKLLIRGYSLTKEPVYHLSDVVKELETFFTDEFKKCRENVPDEFKECLIFVQLATLGHILPRVCVPDKDFLANLFKLIEERALLIKASQEQAQQQGKIIHEEKDYSSLENL